MAVLMFLNGAPFAEIWYGACLCGVFLITALAVDAARWNRKWERLRKLEENAEFTLDGLDKPWDLCEASYQELLRKLLREKLVQREEMQEKTKDMKEYYSMWVHQIKTPIAALRLLLQERNAKMDTAEEQDELFRVEQYVEMALQYMRLDSESTDFVIRRNHMDEMVREAVRKYARLFIHKKIRLVYEGIEGEVLTDAKWTQFVLEQILSNAIKYTSEGSISIYMEEPNVLAVEDTGIGIRAEDLPRVCEKGYTGYNGHENNRSTGIGLYLCSRVMKKMSHSLKIESQEGVGTKVTIRFPEKDNLTQM